MFIKKGNEKLADANNSDMDRNDSDNNDNGYAGLETTQTFQTHTQDKVLTTNWLCFSNSDNALVGM